jgi:hypothetical protein
MKLFEVVIDNDPGGWKSGNDNSVLVIAKTEEEAIEKVKKGWSYNWETNNGNVIITYTQKPDGSGFTYISLNANLHAKEVKFADYDVHIKNPRKAKLDRIEKNIKRDKENEK